MNEKVESLHDRLNEVAARADALQVAFTALVSCLARGQSNLRPLLAREFDAQRSAHQLMCIGEGASAPTEQDRLVRALLLEIQEDLGLPEA